MARKILCSAHESLPFKDEDRERYQGWHARAMIRVIRRHLKLGYRLRAAEEYDSGNRIDLVFERPIGGLRICEVKSAKELNELHKIQAALYWKPGYDEVVVSNGETDILLSAEYVSDTRRRARLTSELLTAQPHLAAARFTPDSTICRYCANSRCPYRELSIVSS
ncbi:MAG: hypothetical protein WB643_10300 [Candidatus Bathyarchaeia archaeon]